MKNNGELQKDVYNAIKWEPLLHNEDISVTARNGIITLTGIVDSLAKKSQAEDAAKKIAGVNAVVQKIEIKFRNSNNRVDNEIANDLLNAIKWNWEIPNDKVKVKVENGWVTLEGELKWNHLKEIAKNLVGKINGVKGVTNNIVIISDIHDKIEKKAIEQAFKSNWSLEEKLIQVEVTGNIVTLLGTVDSWYQKDEAARIAWNAPGVYSVNNQLVIEHDILTIDK